MSVITKDEFAEHPDRAMDAAVKGPVYIVEDGEPTHVMLNYDDYTRIKNGDISLAEALAMPGLSDIELDYSLPDESPRPPQFP